MAGYRQYYQKKLNSFAELLKYFEENLKLDSEHYWVYRGQGNGYNLETTLERECLKSHFNLNAAPGIELQMIRDFKRIYDGFDRQDVLDDTLYCISLMRHHGAPSRLLDFTYSPYVAIYFALESAHDDIPVKVDNGEFDYEAVRSCVIWCINTMGLLRRLKEKYHLDDALIQLINARDRDTSRNETTFQPLYISGNYPLVLWENPIRLHTRLHIQQGVLLCPGDIKKTFWENLLYPYSDNMEDIAEDIKKIICYFTPEQLQQAFQNLKEMNITREALFPGLDGLAGSMNYQISRYAELDKENTGN